MVIVLFTAVHEYLLLSGCINNYQYGSKLSDSQKHSYVSFVAQITSKLCIDLQDNNSRESTCEK